MGLFKRGNKDQREESVSVQDRDEVDSALDISSLIGAAGETATDEGGTDEKDALLGELSDVDQDSGQGDGQTDSQDEPGQASDDQGEDDELMSIFTTEEVEDEGLTALTRDLGDVDTQSLLVQAREVVGRFRPDSETP